ncbi:dihydrofolate reductase family protein [Ponticoccus alexandrii]|uniref:Dihydrofolate reductase n=1 Tax=Ponticoccus alexandrii TaxID=1943633 RepID=A0ABX7F958_9RHOB|nr:dihydrofolate reductase family protein [Ponticoccus alexandrii]ETA49807.1 deaminase/reductase [Rhodobacteraceae bacterium PD-2]QRF66099.1 dihydrofolate reductase [Ponticoccus alexandrii]
MITGHVFVACSLDGFIARSDHGLDWLSHPGTEDEEHGYEDFIAGIDGIVMGSASYRKVRSFPEWPYDKPVVVLSESLQPEDIPEELDDRVRLSRARPVRLMETLEAEGWRNVYVDGGALIQSFLRAGLISEMTITHVPVLIGSGRRLFGALEEDITFDLMETRSFRSGLVSTRYRLRPKA